MAHGAVLPAEDWQWPLGLPRPGFYSKAFSKNNHFGWKSPPGLLSPSCAQSLPCPQPRVSHPGCFWYLTGISRHEFKLVCRERSPILAFWLINDVISFGGKGRLVILLGLFALTKQSCWVWQQAAGSICAVILLYTLQPCSWVPARLSQLEQRCCFNPYFSKGFFSDLLWPSPGFGEVPWLPWCGQFSALGSCSASSLSFSCGFMNSALPGHVFLLSPAHLPFSELERKLLWHLLF